MPSPIRDAMPDLIAQELRRETPALARKAAHGPSDVEPMNPYLTSLLGGLADTASTYAFLKRGTATEDNAMTAGLAHQPGMMALAGAAGNVAIPLLIKKALGKRHPKIADALAANQGALQMGYGAINTQNTMSPRVDARSESRNTSDMYRAALMAKLRKDSK